MPPYAIKWTNEALDFITSLQKTDSQRIVRKIEQAAGNPGRFLERLKGCEDYKLRVGDYRAIMLVNHAQNEMVVKKIGHRKNIYKKMR